MNWPESATEALSRLRGVTASQATQPESSAAAAVSTYSRAASCILDVSNDAGGQRQPTAIGQRSRHRVFLDETPVSGASNDFFVTEVVDYGVTAWEN